MGRPRKTIAPTQYAIITELSARGVSEINIAKALGMNGGTFTRIKRDDARAAAALAEGKALEHEKLFSVLFEAATKDRNTVAAMFLLKCRHGYREQADLTPQNAVQITFQIPGALKAEEYSRLINHDARSA